MEYKKKLMVLLSLLICLVLTMPQLLGYNNIQNNSNTNPRSYTDVHFILITNMYSYIRIDGFHNLEDGYGADDYIILQESNRIRLFGILLIHNGSTILESSRYGGWIHTKIEINGYIGWMKDHNTNQHLKMTGFCDEIIITTYR
jgi:hypothetical protein